LDVWPAVETDIEGAADWYELQREGLDEAFVTEIRRAIRSLSANPHLHRVRVRYRRLEVRWLFAKRFPHRIIYYIEGNAVRVFAVFHAKRDDREWKRRL
jgi:plasmid stabilization system protein ParE